MPKAYYRLVKPGIVYANALTAAAGFIFASKANFQLVKFIALVVGTSLVIAAACAINNYLDRNIDKKMSRTKGRPLVTGEIGAAQAWLFALLVLIAGFVLLVRFTNWLTVGVGLIAFVDYVVLYGVAKRLTPYSTIVGSISGAASILAGYTAVTGRLNTAALLLFLIMVFWQMPHFYAIAIFRAKDYRNAGIPVLPLARSYRRTHLEIVAYVVAFMLACIALTIFGYAGYLYLLVMVAASLYWLRSALRVFSVSDIDNVTWARRMFGLSLVVMMLLSVMLPLGSHLP